MSGGAIIARQNRYMQTFKKAGATSIETAKTLRQLKIVSIGIFRRMEKAGVFVKTEDDKYYMDEHRAEVFIIRRAKYARLVLGLFVFGVVIVFLINGWV